MSFPVIKYFVCESSKCIIMGNMEAGVVDVGGSYMKDVTGSVPVQVEDYTSSFL